VKWRMSLALAERVRQLPVPMSNESASSITVDNRHALT
jgi:hypothetical protein